MPNDRKYASLASDTQRSDQASGGNVADFRLRVIEEWISKNEPVIDKLEANMMWWTGAAAATGAIGALAVSIGVVILAWFLGFFKVAVVGVLWSL